MRHHRTVLLALAVLLLAFSANASLVPMGLRCEYLVDPLGIDELHPRLSWRVESNERAQVQTAYRIIVAATETELAAEKGTVWDSGKVASSETVNVPYEGKALGSAKAYYWKVRVWDGDGKPSDWSPSAKWSMGLLTRADWKARFISFRDRVPVYTEHKLLFLPPSRQYRREFALNKGIRRATVYATALGVYELHLNGQRVGDAYFTPGWTDYRKRAYYNTYDITGLLKRGTNVLGAWVADGWYAGYLGFAYLTGLGTEGIGRYTYGKTPAVMAQVEVEYEDGSRQTLVTDDTWKVTDDGPIQYADILMGELYDGRREMKGWSEPGFDDTRWEPAIFAEENGSSKAKFFEHEGPPSDGKSKFPIRTNNVELGFVWPARLEAYPAPPIRRVQELKPVKVSSPDPGVYVFDLGQNIAGVAKLKVKGAAGTVLRVRHAEMVYPDGLLMTNNLRNARAIDDYILRGDPNGETLIPRFTYHGFQYVEVAGLPARPDLDAVTGVTMNSDTALTGDFECSDPMVNQLYRNILWTQRANTFEVPTDCPQRDERLGWMGDTAIYARAATFNADMAAFYGKWLRDVMDAQRANGVFVDYAPFPFQHEWDFSPGWCDAGVIVPWTIYQVYGDKRLLERCWPSMTHFMDWRSHESTNFAGVVHGNGWGDWLALNERTPLDYIDIVYYAWSAKLMGEMAAALDKTADAIDYKALFQKIAKAFQQKYVRSDGSLAVDTQTAYALALFVDLIPKAQRSLAVKRLAMKIRENGSRMATGFLGTRPLFPVLSDNGERELALELFQ
ncbi:MAG TPA: family 78 glycoside hydrolase catalytic domain, partial [Candidatus Dormibacteraeota bacterium]|nr:family 78 glycoside hydrolase catalytic domain [Candidatus Dormibacteraeota bacterium]